MQCDLLTALLTGDFARAEELVRAGADLNEMGDSHDESILRQVISDWENSTKAQRHSAVRWLLDHGADLTLRDSDGTGGPLFAAVISQDVEILRMLLDAGADPNTESDPPESLYEWAEFDYRYETYDLNLPERPTDADRQSEDTWLDFIDRIAVKHASPRPEMLLLLRQRGALTSREQQRLKNGDSNPC